MIYIENYVNHILGGKNFDQTSKILFALISINESNIR